MSFSLFSNVLNIVTDVPVHYFPVVLDFDFLISIITGHLIKQAQSVTLCDPRSCVLTGEQ